MTRMRQGTPAGADERALAAHQLGLDTLQVRHVQDLVVRAEGDGTGTFEGWACRWDVVDTYGTTFRRGCFDAGGLDRELYALLWMHSPFDPVGTFTAEERDQGLWIAGGWDGTPEGQAKRAMASTSAPGLSVGFVPITVDPDDTEAFTACRLVETSQITRRMASVPGAELTAARAITRAADAQAAQVAIARLRLADAPRLG